MSTGPAARAPVLVAGRAVATVPMGAKLPLPILDERFETVDGGLQRPGPLRHRPVAGWSVRSCPLVGKAKEGGCADHQLFQCTVDHCRFPPCRTARDGSLNP